MLKPRRPEILALIVAIYVVLVLNQPFWRKFIDVVAPRHYVSLPLPAGAHVGHDNLFHSALGIMQVVTRAYDPSLDLFAACRKPAS